MQSTKYTKTTRERTKRGCQAPCGCSAKTDGDRCHPHNLRASKYKDDKD